jgi:LDH2 family malate/lactate/ureidoglycolate dehydrogenase
MAVDTGIFGDRETIKNRMSAFLRELRDSGKAEGRDRVYTHGEKEMETMASRAGGEIPVNPKTMEEMRAIAEEQGVPWDLP